jgi:hypothetical protein
MTGKLLPGAIVNIGTGTPNAHSSSTAAAVPVGDSMPKAPKGSLAHTGADATPWLIGGEGALIAVGGGALAMARRRRAHECVES